MADVNPITGQPWTVQPPGDIGTGVQAAMQGISQGESMAKQLTGNSSTVGANKDQSLLDKINPFSSGSKQKDEASLV